MRLLMLLLAFCLLGCQNEEVDKPAKWSDLEAKWENTTLPDKCSVCGRPLALSDGSKIIGMLISGREELRSQFAPYEPTQYAICFSCLMKAMGVKISEDKKNWKHKR